MTAEQIEAATGALEELIAQYQAIEGTPIPNAIKDAVAENWELVSEHLELGALRLSYPVSQRKIDSRRMIRFGDAMRVLQEMEEKMVEDLVLDELDILWGQLKSYVDAFKWLADNWNDLGKLWDQFWDVAETAWKFIEDGLPAVVAHLTLTLALPAFAKVAKRAILTRDLFPDQMRKRALPQREVKREYRRKIARL